MIFYNTLNIKVTLTFFILNVWKYGVLGGCVCHTKS